MSAMCWRCSKRPSAAQNLTRVKSPRSWREKKFPRLRRTTRTEGPDNRRLPTHVTGWLARNRALQAQGATNAKAWTRQEAKELAKPLLRIMKAALQELKLSDCCWRCAKLGRRLPPQRLNLREQRTHLPTQLGNKGCTGPAGPTPASDREGVATMQPDPDLRWNILKGFQPKKWLSTQETNRHMSRCSLATTCPHFDLKFYVDVMRTSMVCSTWPRRATPRKRAASLV
eukprot:2068439-Pleurochrysis_carterae.AAC.1